jgi:hypothetical protein
MPVYNIDIVTHRALMCYVTFRANLAWYLVQRLNSAPHVELFVAVRKLIHVKSPYCQHIAYTIDNPNTSGPDVFCNLGMRYDIIGGLFCNLGLMYNGHNIIEPKGNFIPARYNYLY